jgi:hypothetical protein
MLREDERVTTLDNAGWTKDQVMAGLHFYGTLQAEVAEAVGRAGSLSPHALVLLGPSEIVGVIVHGLLESAMRQILAARLTVSLADFERAARFVYRSSCHEGDGEDHLH